MKKGFGLAVAAVYLMSTVFFCGKMTDGREVLQGDGQDGWSWPDFSLDASDFGVACLSSAYPGIQLELSEALAEKSKEESENPGGQEGVTLVGSDDNDEIQIITGQWEETPEPVVFGDDPAVLIVHTHATESYLPASSGNYHTKDKTNSVRQVGEVLAETLEKNGIAAVHDTTLHDNPSYSNSYSRSYETTEELLKKYPSVICVIDLHRDAVSAETAAATVSVGGKTCAKYSYVVSTAVDTYGANKKFIENMNKMAVKRHEGFTGRIIERGYKYNQNLSSKYMLLEIGYNRNDISEAVNTAEVFGKILAETLKAGY